MAIRVGVVGFGYAGRMLHAPLIRASGLDLSAIVTSRPGELGPDYSDVPVFASLTDMLRHGSTELVVIATPNHLHAPQAAVALEAGRNVLIDKPPALNSSEIRSLIDLAHRSGKKIGVFFNRRLDSDFLTIRRLFEARSLGRVNAFHMRWDRFRPKLTGRWRDSMESGGGLLLDLGSHMVDQAIQLFGFPHWVQAFVTAQREGATTDDAFEIQMGRDRLVMTLGVSSLAAAATDRYVIHGSEGSFVKPAIDIQEQQLREDLNPQDPEFGCEPPDHWGRLTLAETNRPEPLKSERGCWLEHYNQMRRSIEFDEAVPVSLAETLDVMRVIEAARQSSLTGKRVEF